MEQRSTDPGRSVSQTAPSRFRLAELILPLALATDVGTGAPMDSALRACLLAVRFGEALGLSDDDLRDLYYLMLLWFAGCTADSHIAAAIFGDEIAFRTHVAARDVGNPSEMLSTLVRFIGADRPPLQRASSFVAALGALMRESNEMATGHCEVAELLAGRLGMRPQVQAALRQVFERWDGKGMPTRLKGEQLALPVRVGHIAQQAALFHQLGGTESAIAMARQRAGGAFDPALVEQFCQVAHQLCIALDVESLWDAVLDAEPEPRPRLSAEQLEAGTRALADFVDLKSPYLAGHSSGVAALAAAATQRCGLPHTDVTCVRQAGYLHDIGRVSISAAIWGKPSALTDGEWERVRLHPYYTERIFARSRPLAQLGAIGALHHERLDGSGYHRALPAPLLSPLVRILTAADVYHAMTEPRPHRAALPSEAAADALRREVRLGRLDGEAVHAVLAVAGHRVSATRRAWVAGLSDREVEVLRLVARGLSNQQIAARLSISKQTAGHHIRHIYDKIDVSTRAAATFFAMQHNLVHEPGELPSAAA
jgi:HD-GYP domain-containing protein (c-di-GMP phosphodiesterase class II)/DNA-binding CsgD family transcriptional regulator